MVGKPVGRNKKIMPTLTIPKELTSQGELVVIPRKEYEEFLRLRLNHIKEVAMTPQQKKILQQARKNLAQGKFLTIHELKQKLGIKG